MIFVLLLVVLVEALKAHYESLAQDKWGCCTVQTPTYNWEPSRTYCAFISHYKLEVSAVHCSRTRCGAQRNRPKLNQYVCLHR